MTIYLIKKKSLCKVPRVRNLSLEEVRIKLKMGHNESTKQQGREKKKIERIEIKNCNIFMTCPTDIHRAWYSQII